MPRKREQPQRVIQGLRKLCKHFDWRTCPCKWYGSYRQKRQCLTKWWGPIDSYATAQKALIDWQKTINDGTYDKRGFKVVVENGELTLSKLYKEYEERHMKAMSGTGPLASQLGLFLEEFGQDYPLRIAKQADRITQWLEKQEKKREWLPKTWNNYHGAGQAFFNWIRKTKQLDGLINPFEFVPRKSGAGQVIREQRFTQEQQAALIKAAEALNEPANDHDHRNAHRGDEMKNRLIGALETGLRSGELLKVQLKHINFSKWEIRLAPKNTKAGKLTGRIQTIYVETPRLRDILTKARFRLQQNDDAYVFGTWDGYKVETFQDLWIRMFEAAGLNVERKKGSGKLTRRRSINAETGLPVGYVWHDIRHEFVSTLADKNLNIKQIMVLGRVTIQTANRYLNADSDSLKQAMRKLA